MHTLRALGRRLSRCLLRPLNMLMKAKPMSLLSSVLLRRLLLVTAVLAPVPGIAQTGPLIVSHPQVIEVAIDLQMPSGPRISHVVSGITDQPAAQDFANGWLSGTSRTTYQRSACTTFAT